ncbi:MAG: isovaleryl-CoA dehydrogenase [Rhodospirillales bacterium]|nr:isovaleryl-CoA dehydrogenase [Rhodospirillales bacterium]
MSYLLDDDSKMLRESAERFFAGLESPKLLRQRRNARDLSGEACVAWDGMVELGFAGILIPEEFGGVGLSGRAGIQISEMMGRTLATGPFLSSAVMAATALSRGNNRLLKTELLPAIAAGTVVALAAEETARHHPYSISAAARPEAGGFRISGRKIAVIDGNTAEKLIVVARIENTDRLIMLTVDADAVGVAISARMGLDSHPQVEITFDDVRTAEADLICDPGETRPLLDRVYDAGRLHLAAEMLGAAQEAFDRTIEYLKTRVQFGRKIGEFQALQHRAAILFGELEIARSTVLKASATQSADSISLAKARVSEIAKHVAGEAVQMHGGIGVTDDFDIGFFLKRIRAASELLGDSAFHAERYAGLQGL